MSLLNFRRPVPAPTRQPGRHSAEWAAMQQGLIALQERCRAAEASGWQVEQLRQQHAREMQSSAAQFGTERKGWQDALEHASREYAAIKQGYGQVRAECLRLRADNARLQRVLDASDGQPTMVVPALADEPESFTAVPFPAPLSNEPRLAAPIPPGPFDCEAADRSAETQPVDVRSLRAALDATAVHPVAAVPPATANPGPVHVTWTGGLSTRPPMPDEAPTERISAITAVMPIFDRSIPVVPAEVSPTAGDRAQASVLAAVGSPQ